MRSPEWVSEWMSPQWGRSQSNICTNVVLLLHSVFGPVYLELLSSRFQKHVSHHAGYISNVFKTLNARHSRIMDGGVELVMMSMNWSHKGRPQFKKNVFFRALPESPKPPPPWPEFGQLGPLFSEVEIQDLKKKKQLKVQYIGIFEEIDSFYWPKMHF